MRPPLQPRLRLAVVNSNLRFIGGPLMLGHYLSGRLTGTERAMNRLIGGTMAQSLASGHYPHAPGTVDVFVNTRIQAGQRWLQPRPAAVIVVGLGAEGELRSGDLSETVCQGVLAYAKRLHETSHESGQPPATFSLASTAIGSGGSGIQVGTAVQAITRGVDAANLKLAASGWPQVDELRLVELYLDRATEAHHALRALAESRPERYEVEDGVRPGEGAHRRPPDSGYRGTGYDFISAVQRLDVQGRTLIEYTLDTARARSEVRAQSTQAALVDELVRQGADAASVDPQLRRTLFDLLVPIELEPFLNSSSELLLQLNSDSARIPWELLDASAAATTTDAETPVTLPWAIRCKLLRKLRIERFRSDPVDARDDNLALVIGAPACDETLYPPLPGAEAEADAVAQVLGTNPLIGSPATRLINELHQQRWRIVHIAGHGEIRADGSSGVVLSNGARLGACEIAALRVVPELVFVNCCHLGRVDGTATESRQRTGVHGSAPAQYAATLAQELIAIGVRCVVAAGWAVDDAAASTFASVFYTRLRAGNRYIDAVAQAREQAWRQQPEGNTWAAYQCYGDPDWRYATEPGNGAELIVPTLVSAPALCLWLESNAIEARMIDADAAGQAWRERQLTLLRQTQAAYSPIWGRQGAVAECFGLAFAELGDIATAIDWYQRAAEAEDASASLRVLEQWAHLRVRQAESMADGVQARVQLQSAIEMLERLCAASGSSATVERQCLLGAAFKRLTLLEEHAGQSAAALAALQRCAEHYGLAERRAWTLFEAGLAAVPYFPALNAQAASLRRAILTGEPAGLDEEALTRLDAALAAQAAADQDLNAMLAPIELAMLRAVAAGRLAERGATLQAALLAVLERAPGHRAWDSVRYQLRFVLRPLTARDSSAEAGAAQALLEALAA
jgi:tetratricopeptide (TPR) repeat protein